MDRFEPAACLRAIAEARPSLTVQVPATLQVMMASDGWKGADLSSLRAIATGSTDVPVSLIEAVQARGAPVIQIYGATETGPVVIYQTISDAESHMGAIGRAGPGVEARLVANGRDVAEGQVGEIWLRSPTLAKGYWRNPEADAAFAEGWFRTGDLARREADGMFWFADRLKNVIISGGENIYPAELERILRDMPGVAEAAVVGRPDPRWGATPVAVVAKNGPVSRDDILTGFEGASGSVQASKGCPVRRSAAQERHGQGHDGNPAGDGRGGWWRALMGSARDRPEPSSQLQQRRPHEWMRFSGRWAMSHDKSCAV
jgi:fatty-acyl-CoA synthase